MLARTLTRVAASSFKYKLAPLRSFYTTVLGLGEPVQIVDTDAGSFRWTVDELTSQAICALRTNRICSSFFEITCDPIMWSTMSVPTRVFIRCTRHCWCGPEDKCSLLSPILNLARLWSSESGQILNLGLESCPTP